MNSLEFTKVLNEMAEKREPFVVATIVRIEGSTIGKPGFKAIVSKDGKIVYGTVGGVCPESAIATMAMDAIRTGKARVVKVFLEDARKAVEGTIKSQSVDEVYVETNCGGMEEIYVEPYLPAERLVLIGQGGKDDVEDVLVKLGKLLDYEVVVIDHMPVLSAEPNTLITDLDYDLGKFEFGPTDSVVVLTKGERDIKTLEAISSAKVRFVGLLASQQRVKDDLDTLRTRGVSSKFIQSIHAPIGADIGAVAPEEIALSIMTDIVATRHGKHLPHKAMSEVAPKAT
jgi:xanthine dehydrogenase accessory factor